MERGELQRALRDWREPGAVRSGSETRDASASSGLDFLIVQDLFLTGTAQLADVVFPAAAAAFEVEGTVTSSERRVQRVRQTKRPAGNSRDDLAIIFALAARLGHDWGAPDAQPCLGRAALAVAGPRGHELRAARSARRLAVAVLRRGPSRRSRSSTAGSGSARSSDRARRSRRSNIARRSTRSTPSSRTASRPAGGWRSTTPASRPRPTRRRRGAAKPSTSRPRTPRASISPKASPSASAPAAARSSCPCTSTRRSARG